MKTSKLVWLSSVGLLVCIGNVVGDYILEVRTYNYSNPNYLLDDGSCCDEPQCGEPSCDNIFYYCLRSLGTSDRDTECSGGNRSHINFSDAPLNFSQPTVLGLPNPLSLRGLTREWTGVQFFLKVVDYDGQQRPGELVRRVVHNIFSNNITLGVETEPRNFSYPAPPVRSSIVLSFKVECAENYYGQNCSLLCTENITCSGHGQCVDEGNSYSCVCDPNFTGKICSEEQLPITATETETQAPGRNFNLKAVLGGTIGALIFLVLLLLLIVGAMTFKLATRGQERKGKRHALSASTDVLEMEENETYIEMTQAPTVTINNTAYEGVTSNNEDPQTEGDIHYSNINGKSQDDMPVYECI